MGGEIRFLRPHLENAQHRQGAGATPVIPATQEAEVGRIEVRGQPGKAAAETPSWKYPRWKGAGVHWDTG
jgi:hypothetical protein